MTKPKPCAVGADCPQDNGPTPEIGGVIPKPAEPERADGPMRTCVGCRTVAPRSDLLRVVVRDGSLVPDLRRRLAGRGAWLHPRARCLDFAEKRRAFVRALRLREPPDVGAVRTALPSADVAEAAPAPPIGPRADRAGTTAGGRRPSGKRSSSDEYPVTLR